MKKRSEAAILWVFLLILSFAVSGCVKAGSNEIVTTGGNAGTKQSGEGETENQRYEVVLTEEEANQDHLTTKLSDLVEVDAYITPYDLYKNGVGQWHMNSLEKAEVSHTFSEIDPDETVLNTVTFADFVDTIDQMAESLGEVYQEAWEETKTVDNLDFFKLFPNSDINIVTGGKYVAYNEIVKHELLKETENLSFLKRETAITAVRDALRELGFDVSDHGYIGAQDRQKLEQYQSSPVDTDLPECYELEFYQTIDGIPLTYHCAPCIIPAGNMSVDSMYYNARYETERYAVSADARCPAVSIVIWKDGFDCLLYAKRSYTLYSGAQQVVDINEVLQTAGEILHGYNRAIEVTSIELGMGGKVVEAEGEKQRIVLSPYWTVDYYMETQEGGTIIMKRNLLDIDAYSGEILYDGGV